MAELTDPVETGMPRSVRYGIIVVLVILVFMWLLPRRAGKNDAAGPGAKPAEPAAAVTNRETERQLTAILTGLSPELVVISSDRLDRVAELGQWAGEAFAKGDAATVTIDEAANAKWFNGEALKEVNDPSFSLRDGHHITLANLAGEVVTRLSQNTSDPLVQIDELFRFVVRETMLIPDSHDSQLPGTPFETLLIGRSTAAGRAWALGTLLRQLRIDAVILEPKSKPDAWIIGVISPAGDVLLYDPRLGTCVPGAVGPEGFAKAASLELIQLKPELLRELDTEAAAFPLQAEDLSAINVKLITDSSASSQRMAKLQTMIAGSLMEVFDGVGKNPLREIGLADRVIAAGAKGRWSAGDVSVWAYPEQQAKAFMSSGAEEGPAWKGISQVFAGPVALTQVRKQTKGESEAASETDVQRSKAPLRLIRVLQLEWKTQDAIKGYLPIRTSSGGLSMATRDPELQEKLAAAMPRNVKAADFATFWTAACQAQENPQFVPHTLGQYISFFPQGEMVPAVAELWATSLVLAGDQAGAIRLLESGQQRTPRLDVLLKQWRPRADPPKPASEKTPADTPVSSPPDKPTEPSLPDATTSPDPAHGDRPPDPPEAT